MSMSRRAGAEKILLCVPWIGSALFVAAAVVGAWPEYWKYIAAETTPLAWLQSVLLLSCALLGGLVAFSSFVSEEHRGYARAWMLVAAGFLALAADERFAVHERIRDRFLKPTGIRLLPWMEAGDWLPPIYLACGLAVAWGLWKLLVERAGSRRFFVSAIALAAVSVAMDTVDIRSLSKDTERLMQSVEEIVEMLAMLSFLSSFLLILTGRLSRSGERAPDRT